MLVGAGATSASESTVSIPLNLGTTDSVQSQVYSCGEGEPFSVRYVNSGPNALAIFAIDGEDRIFVNVVSASGARYASGAYVWWTSRDSATLENGLEAGSLETCQLHETPSTP